MIDPLQKALQSLPHGPEFRFIDHLVELNPGVSGSAVYDVRGNEPFLAGHFPGQPLFPGVLLLEAAAQLAGVVAQSAPDISPLRNLRLTGMRAIKILGSATPGETLRMDATITGRLGGLIQADVEVRCGERRLLSGSVSLSGESVNR